jgi:hypothetical protein
LALLVLVGEMSAKSKVMPFHWSSRYFWAWSLS